MTEDAYAGFRHAAIAPLVQIDANLFALELFHGPTLAFKDFAMQWLGRAMNARAAPTQRACDDSRRDLGRHRRGGDRGLRRPVADRRLHPLSARTRVRRAAPADDDGRQAQYPRARDRGNVRRLPAHRQGPVRRSGVPRRNAPVGRQLDQLGPHPRADRLLLRRRSRARRAGAADLLLGSDRQFRRRSGWLLRQAHGPAD